MEKKHTSERLKEIMKERNLKQIDIIRLAKPFCTDYGVRLGRNDISQYLSGKVEPRQKKLFVLSKALNVNPAWLMGYNVPINAEDIPENANLQKDNLLGKSSLKNTNLLNKSVKIPVLGTVRAGIPITAVEEILDYEEISSHTASTGEFFGLKIKGNSMEPRFNEGDVVIVRKQSDADNGDIVVVLVNGDEATIKKLKKTEQGIILIPLNNDYEPLFFDNATIANKPVQIIGKVVELRAKF